MTNRNGRAGSASPLVQGGLGVTAFEHTGFDDGPPAPPAAVQFENVGVRYGMGPEVLRDLTFTIEPRSFQFLTGPSGAGKTTLIDLVLGLHRPQAGRILIDGVDLAEVDLQAWREQVGYVPQELILFHDSVFENLTLGDPAYGPADVEEALRLAGADRFVDQLPEGTGTMVGNKGARLSGGQRQRVALARALLRKPRLLVLDEVTSALDPESELAICRNIEDLRSRMTVLAVTHRPAFLDIATRVFELGEGGVRVRGGQEVPAPA